MTRWFDDFITTRIMRLAFQGYHTRLFHRIESSKKSIYYRKSSLLYQYYDKYKAILSQSIKIIKESFCIIYEIECHWNLYVALTLALALDLTWILWEKFNDSICGANNRNHGRGNHIKKNMKITWHLSVLNKSIWSIWYCLEITNDDGNQPFFLKIHENKSDGNAYQIVSHSKYILR